MRDPSSREQLATSASSRRGPAMRLDRVTIGVDFSPASLGAATWAARLFTDSELFLVHVLEVPEPPAFLREWFAPSASMLDAARQSATAQLEELRTALHAEHLTTEVRMGRPAEELAASAREHGTDLVVVARHGANLGPPRRLGSTADRLVRCSPAPVLLATSVRGSVVRRLLVAIDDAGTTPRVLDYARGLARRLDAGITALHVLSPTILHRVRGVSALHGSRELSREEIQNEFRSLADRWIARLVDSGIERGRVDTAIAFGDAAREILATADRIDADMIVMGSRGAGAVRRALLGSVVSEVLRDASRPVLVALEPEDEIMPAAAAEDAMLGQSVTM